MEIPVFCKRDQYNVVEVQRRINMINPIVKNLTLDSSGSGSVYGTVSPFTMLNGEAVSLKVTIHPNGLNDPEIPILNISDRAVYEILVSNSPVDIESVY